MGQFVYLVYRLLYLYSALIFIWCVLSWFVRTGNELVQDVYVALSRIVEPYVGIFRRHIPSMGGVDFSPWIAMLFLALVQRFLLRVFI